MEPEVEREEVKACPRDTNGDGDCGMPACPDCGVYSRKTDQSEVPAPQSWDVTTY